MIWYHQAYDFNHCLFRTLSVLEFEENISIEIEKMKILSFYLLFPAKLSDVRFPRDGVKYKKYFSDIDDRYNNVSSAKITYAKISALSDICFSALSSFGLIERKAFSKGVLKRTEHDLSEKLSNKISEYHDQNQHLFELLTKVFANLPLSGQLGLKVRTDLIDYRYDAR
ncbi:MAG: ABC-three component system middle component 5 [Balneolaceae bacterium]